MLDSLDLGNIHSSIHYLYHLSLEGRGGAGANPSWQWARGRVYPWQVASQSQGRHIKPDNHLHSHIFSLNLELPINLTCGTVGGRRSTRENPRRHRESMQTPHRKADGREPRTLLLCSSHIPLSLCSGTLGGFTWYPSAKKVFPVVKEVYMFKISIILNTSWAQTRPCCCKGWAWQFILCLGNNSWQIKFHLKVHLLACSGTFNCNTWSWNALTNKLFHHICMGTCCLHWLLKPPILSLAWAHSSFGDIWKGFSGRFMTFLYYHHDFQKESADWRLAKLESKTVFRMNCQTFNLKYIHPLHQTFPKSEYIFISICSSFSLPVFV